MNSDRLTPQEVALLMDSAFEPPFAATQLNAGRNNQVYRVDDGNGEAVILKRYFHHLEDSRDRLEHEWNFLQYANRVAPQFVPRPFACSREIRAALIAFVDGPIYRERAPESHVRQAIEFVKVLNASKPPKHELPVAADACFEAADHITLLGRRLSRLQAVTHPGVRAFLDEQLVPAAQAAITKLRNNNGKRTTDRNQRNKHKAQRSSHRILSPSDFGFHNAISRPDGSVCFLDFEYAGWDGPGKLIADFFSQPEIPVDERFLPDFLKFVRSCLGDEPHDQLADTLPVLLAVHGLKWCCILLNGFVPVDSERRAFSGDAASKQHQLQKAQSYFQTICLPRTERLGWH